MKEYKGINGKVVINDDGTFFAKQMFKKETFAFSDITELSFKECGITNGNIAIRKKSGTKFEIVFNNKKQNEFRELFDLINEKTGLSTTSGQSITDPNVIYEFDGGVGDILFVYKDRILIRHIDELNFFAMKGIKRDKTIYLTDITSVQLKKGRLLTAGYLQFSYPGRKENLDDVFAATDYAAAILDENTITFSADKNEKAEEIVNYLNKELKKIKSSVNSTNTETVISSSDEIRKYKALLDDGIITQDEFDSKKKQLLGV